MNTTATPIVTNARPVVAAARSAASTASVAATAVSAAPDNNKKPRFKWKFKIRDKEFDSKTKEAKLVYPFLDNTNEQDFLLTQLILKKAPYKALNNTGGAWKELNDTLAKTKAKDGSLPFAYIGGKTARNRFNEYKELAEYWSDKTGPERPVTPENVEDIIGANEGYSQRIIDAVENIFEEIASMAEGKKTRQKRPPIKRTWKNIMWMYSRRTRLVLSRVRCVLHLLVSRRRTRWPMMWNARFLLLAAAVLTIKLLVASILLRWLLSAGVMSQRSVRQRPLQLPLYKN